MPRIDCEVRSGVKRSFRVEQVAGMMDVPLPPEDGAVTRSWSVEWPGLDQPWTVGAVVGGSGKGKGVVTRAMLGDDFLEARSDRVSPFEWAGDVPVVDGFPAEVSGSDVSAMFQAVGFSDAPSWLVPWPRLSTGQRWRADLARALIVEREVVGVDEFGGLVSDAEAAVVATAVSKAVRKARTGCKRVVLVGAKGVGAGGDLSEGWLRWAEPDWWLDVERGELHRKEDAGDDAGGFCRGEWERPRIEFEVRRCDAGARWPVYRPHHYLSAKLRPGSRGYEAWVKMPPGRSGRESSWLPAGFVAMNDTPGFTGIRTVHRLVVLPTFQGIGLAGRMLAMIAPVEAAGRSGGREVRRVTIRTSHPGLVRLLRADRRWRGLTVQDGRQSQSGQGAAGSFGRATAGFAWVGCDRHEADQLA